MRVLWLCNIMLPFIAQSMGQKVFVKEGWLTGLSTKLINERNENNITLAICFPTATGVGFSDKNTDLFVKGKAKNTDYYIFREDTIHPEVYNERMEQSLKAILDDFNPDMVHIFGTEYPHTLAMVRAYGRPDRTLIGIQGICSLCAKSYMANLPVDVQKKKTFRDMIKKDGLIEQQQKFAKRGEYEKEALLGTNHVTGRTDFDKDYIAKTAPQAKYHFMNETLREEFYIDQWNIDRIERYSIFVSQGNYPIKGLHYLLQVLPDIVERYPETKVYVAGDVITANSSLTDKIKISGYGKYLLNMIKKSGMETHVRFVGRLQSDKMCARYLKSHVFLCPSAIENSPNSVGEAMILGVPVVSADVGGVHNLLEDGKDGFLYPHTKPARMKDHILNIFGDDKLALYISQSARAHALKTHDPQTNYNRLLEIYSEITRI